MSSTTKTSLENFESLLKEVSGWPYVFKRYLPCKFSLTQQDYRLSVEEAFSNSDDENASNGSKIMEAITTFGLGTKGLTKTMRTIAEARVADSDKFSKSNRDKGCTILSGADLRDLMLTGRFPSSNKEEEEGVRCLSPHSSSSGGRYVIVRCPLENEEEAQQMDQLFVENFQVLTEFFPSLTLPHDTCREIARRFGCFNYGDLVQYGDPEENVKFLQVDSLWFGPYLYHHSWNLGRASRVVPVHYLYRMEHLYRYMVAASSSPSTATIREEKSNNKKKKSFSLLKSLWNTPTGRCFLLKQAVVILEDLLHHKFPSFHSAVFSRVPEFPGDDHHDPKEIIDTRILLLTRILTLETCISQWYVEWKDQSRLAEIEENLASQKRHNRRRERLELDGEDPRNLYYPEYRYNPHDPGSSSGGGEEEVDPLSVVDMVMTTSMQAKKETDDEKSTTSSSPSGNNSFSPQLPPPILPLPSWIPQPKSIHRCSHPLQSTQHYYGSKSSRITNEPILNLDDAERLYRSCISRALIHILNWKFKSCGDIKKCSGRGKAWSNLSEKSSAKSGNYAKIKLYRYIRHETALSKTLLKLCFKTAGGNNETSSRSLTSLPEDVIRGPIFDFLFGEQVGYPTNFFSTFKWTLSLKGWKTKKGSYCSEI